MKHSFFSSHNVSYENIPEIGIWTPYGDIQSLVYTVSLQNNGIRNLYNSHIIIFHLCSNKLNNLKFNLYKMTNVKDVKIFLKLVYIQQYIKNDTTKYV